MGVQQPLGAFLFQVSIVFVMFLIVSASEEHKKARGRNSSRKDHNSKVFHSSVVFFVTLFNKVGDIILFTLTLVCIAFKNLYFMDIMFCLCD